ncbi:MAG: bifunctional methylenetetrahydrofolate dehydrogenase/methenyltetrahydrofolate cyclohydrolase FolD [Acidimicrobiia bacterium]|nr:bifunctional methylenetetrahydrofolate dehydrogenase/methenyltetrahydrofolate cyclohydrolase FolD [Acidimicrobiia bacterium]
MTATILDGKAVAAAVHEEVAGRVDELVEVGIRPGLATVLVGDDPASHVYVRNKRRTAEKVGITSFHHELDADTEQSEVEELLEDLSGNAAVHGILLQLPLPGELDGEAAVLHIDPAKDADGLHPANLGSLVLDRPGLRPCTPSGALRILDHYEIETEGRNVVVVGRSFLVGRPLAVMLGGKDRNATVTLAHSRTRGLKELCATADILVAAVGRPQMIKADWVKPGATVLDVGINRTDDGLVGDVDFEEVVEVAGAITPVPGGVGPMTIAMLLANTVTAAERVLSEPARQ